MLVSATSAQPIAFEPIGGPYYRGHVLGVLPDGTLLGTGRSSQLLRSSDGGQRWDDIEAAPPSVGGLEVLADGSILMSASGRVGEGGGLFRSQDRGATWAFVGPDDVRSSSTFATSVSGETWALAVGAHLRLTADGGATWAMVEPADNDDPILALAFDASGDVLVSRYNDDAVSSHVQRWDGSEWADAPTPLGSDDNVKRLRRLPDGQVAAISYAYQSPIFSWFRRYPALYITSDGGDSWQIRDAESLYDVTQRADGGRVVARPYGVDGAGVALPVPLITSLLAAPEGTLYASSPTAGAYALRPGSDSWEQVGTYPWPLPLAEVDGQLVAGADGVLLSRTGSVWTPQPAPVDGVDALNATSTGRLLVSTASGLYAVDRIGDEPRLLPLCGAGEVCLARGVAETAGGALLAAAGCGLYRSTDDGESWTQVLDGVSLRQPSAGPGLALVGEATGFTSCSSSEARSLFASTDDGLTWTRSEDGIADLRLVTTLVTEAGEAYAGSYSGLYRRGPSGIWTRLDASLPRDLAEWNGRVIVAFEDGVGEVVGSSVARVALDGVTVLGLVVRENGDLVATSSGGAFVASMASTAVSDPSPSPSLRIRLRGPNPARDHVRLAVEADAAGRLEVAVFDALGRRVAVLHDGPVTRDVHLSWDAPTSGVYVVRARTPQGQASHTVTVVR